MSEGKKLRILRDILGSNYKIKNEFLFFCPKCKHHKRKLSLNLEKNVFKCWVCDFSGKTIQRLVRKYGNRKQYLEWRELAGLVDITSFSEQLFIEKEEAKERLVELPDEFVSLTKKSLPYDSLYPKNYLKSRNITIKDIARWKIGYCSSGPFKDRIIIPSFGISGHCNYFIARTYQNNWRKYLNPSVSRDIIFNHLYLDFDNDLVIVEGVFDAIVAGPNAVPLLGSTLRVGSKLFQEIVNNDTPVYLALDTDAEKKIKHLIKNFKEYDIEIHQIDISPYDDVGEMSKEEFLKRKNNAEVIDTEDYLLQEILNA